MTFEKRAEFFLAGMKAHWDEGGRRILLGDNTGSGAVMLRPVRFQCVGVCISTRLSLYTFTVDHMYTQFRLSPDLPESDYYVNATVSVLLVSRFGRLFSCKTYSGADWMWVLSGP
jgi:hypothetical protein